MYHNENKFTLWRYLDIIRRNLTGDWFKVRDLIDALPSKRSKSVVHRALERLHEFGWLDKKVEDAYIDKVRGDELHGTKYKQLENDVKHFRVTEKFNEYVYQHETFQPKDNPYIKIPKPSIDQKYLKERFNARLKV